ncbi:MAG TPA: pilus assembly protein TadG-related protein [Jiangellaceae bacterium]
MTRDESGQLTPLIIGFAVIVLLAVAVVANASNTFLHRRSLVSWSDGAATVAAQQVAEQAVYAGRLGETLPFAQDAARAAVLDYVARHDLAERFDKFSVVTVTVDGTTGAVTVEFAARVPLILATETSGFGGGVTVTARTTAVSPLR